MQNPPTEIPTPETPGAGKTKKRHGCLTAWLILMIIAAGVSIIMYLGLAGESFIGSLEYLPGWAIFALIILLIFNIVCAIALFRWKKWGFWGFCAITVIALIINISLGLGVFSLSGLVSVAVLYGVLNIGKENKGWSQLE